MKKKTSHMVLLLVILSMLLSACVTSESLVRKGTREDQIIYGMKGKQKSGALNASSRQSLMSVAEAKQAIREALEKHAWRGIRLENIEIRNDGFTSSYQNIRAEDIYGEELHYNRTVSYKYSDVQVITWMGDYYIENNGVRGLELPRENGKQFVDAVKSMQYHFSNQLIYDDSVAFAEFQQKAKAWRALPQKPTIPEELRRYRVQAEDAFRNKEFDKAIDYYEKGLKVYPLWPEGYFNAAYLCAEVGIYAGAICHMKRYLELSPDAKDAQVSRDKMFVWEGKLGR